MFFSLTYIPLHFVPLHCAFSVLHKIWTPEKLFIKVFLKVSVAHLFFVCISDSLFRLHLKSWRGSNQSIGAASFYPLHEVCVLSHSQPHGNTTTALCRHCGGAAAAPQRRGHSASATSFRRRHGDATAVLQQPLRCSAVTAL